ncbi:MAG: succinylglutamate desuccinylase/aspartoacylase family protein [Pseudomonadota bacterium]
MNNNKLPSHIAHIRGTEPGPRVVVFGGTHGDETTGVLVVQQILRALHLDSEIPSGFSVSPLIKGDLFLGIGNPGAVTADTRSVSGVRDLNRCFHESFFSNQEAMQLPDQQRAFELKDLLASADYFFDLHSVSTKETIPFVGLTTFSKGHAEICSHIPVHHILDVSTILGRDVGLPPEVKLEQTPTTCSWVNRHGGIGLCYEMGYQKDETSVPGALEVLVNLLKQVGIVDSSFHETLSLDSNKEKLVIPNQQVYRLVHCERNKFKNFSYTDPRYAKSFTPVKAGELIGCYDDGEEIRVSTNGLLAFPAGPQTLNINQSLFYLAIPID